jgi:hypothetical protein
VSVHNSEPQVTTGRTDVRYICSLLFLDIRRWFGSFWHKATTVKLQGSNRQQFATGTHCFLQRRNWSKPTYKSDTMTSLEHNLQHHQFYVHGSVHRWSIWTVQQDAIQSSLFITLVHSTCFGCQLHPPSVHRTVTTASGNGHTFCAATSLQRGLASPRWREVAGVVPEAVVTVLCTLDDGCGWHP